MKNSIGVLVLSTFLQSAVAEERVDERQRFELDSVHSQVLFRTSHAGFSDSVGQVLNPQGWIFWDRKNPERSSVEIQMRADKVEFNNQKWNDSVRGEKYFAAEKFPEITFVSTGLQPQVAQGAVGKNGFQPGSRAILTGNLTLLGNTREVQLQVIFNKRAPHPYSLKDTIGFSAHTTLDRTDFGMTESPKTVGTQVTIEINVEAFLIPRKPSTPGRKS